MVRLVRLPVVTVWGMWGSPVIEMPLNHFPGVSGVKFDGTLAAVNDGKVNNVAFW